MTKQDEHSKKVLPAVEFRCTLRLGDSETENPHFFETARSVKDFLLLSPRGAYTATRTLNQHAVMNWSAHINRLLESWYLLFGPNCFGNLDNEEFANEWIKHRINMTLKYGIGEYFSRATKLSSKNSTEEAKITLLMLEPKSIDTVELYIHFDIIQIANISSPCTVVIHGPPRTLPVVKDSKWLSDRKPLEESKLIPGIHELILSDPNGNIYEGLTSNFFCVIREINSIRIETAPLDHVLNGTMLKAVERVCKKLGFGFKFRFPQIRDAILWDGAFITSKIS
ncbi:hypothetical protein HK100_000205 [Physocladia obscura]|uniref:Aminotransferase class IV n=1 Tax=Physocladia obscura TaxID=109957 RepID=A0AAD5SZ24_9FUNG|nr:hypothetical protein HK100_000205 [Physocladia obscura]